MEKILYLRNNLALLNNSQEMNQAHYQRLWNEHTDLLGLVLVPGNLGREDLEMRLNTLRRNIITLATLTGVHLQPFQPQGLANALAAQPQQFWSAGGRPPLPPFSPSQGSPARGDVEQHFGEELSYLADVLEDSPPRRQEHGAIMASRHGDVGSQLNPIPLESAEASEAGTPRRTSTLSGPQARLIQPRPIQRSNTAQRQRHSSSGKQALDDGQPRRLQQTEGGGAGPVRRASHSLLRKTPYPLNPPSFSQAPPNLAQHTYSPSPHYKSSARSFSPGPPNPIQQPYSPHPHYRPTAPAYPQAPQDPMTLAQRQASITLLITGEAFLPNPVVLPQGTPREQFTQHWDGVLNQIAGGIAMRGENPAGAARRLALYNQQYPRERASVMAPPAPLTAFQRDQSKSTSLPEGTSAAENELLMPMSPSPYEQDEDGTLAGPLAPPPSGPFDSLTYNAPSRGRPAQPMSGNSNASIYDSPSPSPLAPPPSDLLDYPTHNEPSPRPPAPHPPEPFDASIYDASPPADAVISSPSRDGDSPPAPPDPGPATLTPAGRLAASYYRTETPDWHGLNHQQQRQQQQQQDTADAAAAAAMAAVEAAASPSISIPGNWDASSFEYDGDGHTEPN